MEYGPTVGGLGGGDLGLGGAALGVGGGAVISMLPNTGGSLRVLMIAAIFSITLGLMVVLSAMARLIMLRRAS